MGIALEISARKIEPLTLRHRVAEMIREAIFSGKLTPGDRIVELRLAKQLGVGTTAVREALFDLERQGFVQRVVNKGSYLTKLSLQDIQQIYRLRIDLEGLAVELLTEHSGQADIDELEKLIRDMEAAARGVDSFRFYQKDMEFHRTAWRLSRNRYLINALETAVLPLFAFFLMRLPRDSHGNLLRLWEWHDKVLNAIKFEGPARAREAMEQTIALFLEHDTRLVSPDKREMPGTG